MRRWSWLAAACLIGGCALITPPSPQDTVAVVQPPAPLEQFRLQGRISVHTGEKQFSGGMVWQRSGTDENLLLSTPLGQGVAELHLSPAGAELLDADGRRHLADDAESLLRNVAGMDLPVTGLSAWVTGAPHTGTPFQAAADGEGHVVSIDQDGWHVEFSRYGQQAGRWLPGKVVARRGDDLEVKLVIDEWGPP